MALVLWLLAVILVVAGIVCLFRRQWLPGIVLIIVGFLVGPGGVSIFDLDDDDDGAPSDTALSVAGYQLDDLMLDAVTPMA